MGDGWIRVVGGFWSCPVSSGGGSSRGGSPSPSPQKKYNIIVKRTASQELSGTEVTYPDGTTERGKRWGVAMGLNYVLADENCKPIDTNGWKFGESVSMEAYRSGVKDPALQAYAERNFQQRVGEYPIEKNGVNDAVVVAAPSEGQWRAFVQNYNEFELVFRQTLVAVDPSGARHSLPGNEFRATADGITATIDSPCK